MPKHTKAKLGHSEKKNYSALLKDLMSRYHEFTSSFKKKSCKTDIKLFTECLK